MTFPHTRRFSLNGVVWLWNVPDATLTASFTASTNTNMLLSTAYSGRLGIIATADNIATRVWQVDPTQVAAAVCQTLHAPVSVHAWDRYLPEYPYTPICGR